MGSSGTSDRRDLPGPRSRLRFLRAVLVVLLALVGVTGTGAIGAHAAPATPTYVQGRANEAAGGTKTNSVAYSSANTAGNFLVVYAIWDNTSAATVSDTRGNTYASVAAASRWKGNGWSSQVFYAKNVAGGANTVTLTLGTAVSGWSVVYVHEYSGIDKVSPLDVSAVATGTASAMNSGSATTTNATDLVFGAGASDKVVNGGGTGFTSRLTTYGNRTQDKRVTATGSNASTASQNGNAWVMHMVAFKADPGTPSDTSPPTTPTGLTATPAATDRVNLSWNPSSDNVSVAGYRVFRNGTQVGSPGTTLFQDTGLSPNTTYSYTVAAVDGAGNASPQSAPVSATTNAAPPDVTPPTATLTAPASGATVLGTVNVTANASDDVAVLGVQFLVDGANAGPEDTTAPYAYSWDTTAVGNGTHTLAARARDGASHLTTSTPVTVTVNNPARPPGLLAGYAFDEGAGGTVADASGHGLTGTLANGAGWAVGRFGTAAGLDGVNDAVSLGSPASLQLTGSMTLGAWIYATGTPGDDGAIISKRGSTGFQLDTTVDVGPRVVGFKLTNGSGGDMFRYGATALQLNTWYYVAGVYNATAGTMDVYVNGQLDNGPLVGSVTGSQLNPSTAVLIGQRGNGGFNFPGRIDDARIYGRALTPGEIGSDMTTPLGTSTSGDPNPPTVTIDAPAAGATVSDIVTVTADAADNVGVVGVQFSVDGVATGVEDTTDPYALTWDTRTSPNGSHTLTARARDAAGNLGTSVGVTVNVSNTNTFQNEVLATGLNLPTAMKFLPDGRLLVAELAGRIRVIPNPYTTPDATPFLQISNIGSAGVQQGIYDFAFDPAFATNRYFYVFYTAGTPNRDRLSRFTANATLTGTVAGSELVLYQDPQDANAEHHGGAIVFGNDGKLYFTTGEHFDAAESQDLSNPRGKLHRINTDGTVPTDGPFYDGNGRNWDSIWAYGLRNPYRAFYDSPTGRLFIGDVGGNDYSTAKEEVNLGARGANYGWPDHEGACAAPCTSPLYSWAHNGRDSAITGGFVYHGTAFPSGYDGSYFFADYTQNWIKRLTLDAAGNLTGVYNFEPADGSVDGPYGDIVYLTEGPDQALYYLDLGYSDISGSFGVSKVRRIKFVSGNQAPVVSASADVTSGPAPLSVHFSSAGSSDPEGHALSYTWDFGDNVTSTEANPTHVYTQAGTFQARLTVSDGTNSSTSVPIAIAVGRPPAVTITAPTDGAHFVANDVITFAGTGTDPEDGTLPASAFTWNIDFLHEGHVHPGTPVTGVKSGTFTIPTSGHDFSGNTRYRITLTVKDSTGLTSSTSVIVYPTKVNLTFQSSPAGLTLYLDGIAKTTPFVYDTLVGFQHTVEARNQSANGVDYVFGSWSDSGTQTHTVTVPGTDASYLASFSAAPRPLAFVQVAAATPQSPLATVTRSYPQNQAPGDLNVVVVGWNDTTSNISSVTDSAGNTYALAAPVVRGSGVSQAIYYAKNIVGGANTVTVSFNQSAAYVDVRVAEYSGVDRVAPLDGAAGTAGSAASATSGNLTTTAKGLVVGAGTTTGGFTSAGSGFSSRIITTPDLDILEDRVTTAGGTYAATAPQNGSYVMQAVAFKAAAP